jgi:hypothetical protein
MFTKLTTAPCTAERAILKSLIPRPLDRPVEHPTLCICGRCAHPNNEQPATSSPSVAEKFACHSGQRFRPAVALESSPPLITATG